MTPGRHGKIFMKFTSSRSFSNQLPLVSLLQRCSRTQQLKVIHTHLIVIGFIRYTYIISRLLASAAAQDLNYAQSVFNQINHPTIFDWNTLIQASSKAPKPHIGLSIYVKMRRLQMPPNMHTFPFLTKACNDLFSATQLHAQILKFGMGLDAYVITSLINVYSKYGDDMVLARRVFVETPIRNRNVVCWTSLITGYSYHGHVHHARKLFDNMPQITDVSWSAMISGYVRNDCFNEAIQLFHELEDSSLNLKPNQSLLVSVLNACAGLGVSAEGKWVHSYIHENGFDEYGLELGTALVDFYAKCGCVQTALKLFHQIRTKDVMSWSAIIMGLAINGYCDLALKLFLDMKNTGTKPNAITFIGVLTACSHGGLVDQGWRFYESMIMDYGISPTIQHYGCMVDILCRAGRIKQAEKFVNHMPVEPDGIIWGALLNGCVMYGHMELGERVGKHLIEVEPQNSGRYVLLANMYAAMGKWDSVTELRRLMKERRVTTSLGWSFVDISGIVHRFTVNDKSHSLSEDIYGLLNQLNMEMTKLRSCIVEYAML